jgi:hypothetical protein
MKARDVPQDNSRHYEGRRRACYALDEHGRYTVVPSNGWETERVVNQLAIADLQSALEETRRRALAGLVSPLAFHMQRCQMTVPMLAANTGLWRLRVRWHLRPAVFARLAPELLARYAGALRMSVAGLKQVPEAP